MKFLAQIINGLSLGSIYALIALGYTMVYGIAKMINFAHGDIIMVGAYSVYLALTVAHLPVPVAILIGIMTCAILGVIIEKIAYKPLRNAPSLAVLITAIGVSYFLQSASLILFGSQAKAFQSIVTLKAIHIGEITISGEIIVTIMVTLISMILLTLFINKTKAGSAMLAVSEDKGAAKLMGIHVDRTISMVFAIGSGLAAVAGILYACTYGFIDPYMGSMAGIKAFVAAVLGGIGSVPGAMIGGILLGVIESLSKAYISTQLADAIVFGVLILMLIIKPAGILGVVKKEKV
ncbi:MAG: branched-chain amino acid ABC transporter permease [Firmicutes bacterium]|uniref:Branched-chain amino acid ABC transporter permease n=1 Tax=Candidatus Scybalomonas excrementavium TaxID=2840943 RepID=A0A9D9HZW7_9FIRM|nr:branched-chain amino acid ABC transporter permease [Candidatus Scybalomonas excrementavium]